MTSSATPMEIRQAFLATSARLMLSIAIMPIPLCPEYPDTLLTPSVNP
jgi:hypothetical protein